MYTRHDGMQQRVYYQYTDLFLCRTILGTSSNCLCGHPQSLLEESIRLFIPDTPVTAYVVPTICDVIVISFNAQKCLWCVSCRGRRNLAKHAAISVNRPETKAKPFQIEGTHGYLTNFFSVFRYAFPAAVESKQLCPKERKGGRDVFSLNGHQEITLILCKIRLNLPIFVLWEINRQFVFFYCFKKTD